MTTTTLRVDATGDDGHESAATTPTLTAAFAYLLKWGTNGTGNGQFNLPRGVAIGPGGMVYVADSGNHRIQRFTPDGVYMSQWGSYGTGDGQFSNPSGIAVAANGTVYVVDTSNHRIQRFDASGSFLGKWGAIGSGDGQFGYPVGVALAADGTVYVVEEVGNRVQYFEADGTYLGQWGSNGDGNGEFAGPYRVGLGADGTVYVTDGENYRVQYFDADGTYIGQWGSYGTGDGQFSNPSGIAVAPDTTVYVADSVNNRIQRFQADGTYLHKFGSSGSGNSQFIGPVGVAISVDGTVYIADTNNHRIVAWDDGLRVSAAYPVAGLIFRDVPIDNAETVNEARLRIVPKRAQDDIDATVKGEGEPASFATAAADLSGRSMTTAAVTWTAGDLFTGEGEYATSVDVKTIVQEIVSGGGWATGDDLALFLIDRGLGGSLVFFPYDTGPDEYSPELYLSYGTVGTVTTFAFPSSYWPTGYWPTGYWPKAPAAAGPSGSAVTVKMFRYLRQMGS